jgi:hypothetical protein
MNDLLNRFSFFVILGLVAASEARKDKPWVFNVVEDTLKL